MCSFSDLNGFLLQFWISNFFLKEFLRIIDETARVLFTDYNYTIEFVEGSSTTI